MDLNTITAVLAPRSRQDLPAFVEGDACLAGGTWLFSEPQPQLTRLVDLSGMDWAAFAATEDGLTIGATCPVATLEGFEAPVAWRAAALIGQCCRSFLASFKIQAVATVGGNLCMALPAGPMISLCTALDGLCTIWTRDRGERTVPMADFVLGPQRTALRPGEILRAIHLPAEALGRRTAFRRISLTPLGRSAALLIGTRADDGRFALTVTASTPRPVQFVFAAVPSEGELLARIEGEIAPSGYYDDVHGAPDWRRHMTLTFAEEIRAALA